MGLAWWFAISGLLSLLATAIVLDALSPNYWHYLLIFSLSSLLILLTIVFNCCVKASPPLTDHFVEPIMDIESPTQRHGSQPRMHYLDNLRSFLTVLVVLHHCTLDITSHAKHGHFNTFRAVFRHHNDTYFMHLFFFIAGFFVPASYERKGARLFLKDRFKRLGLPMVGYFFVLGPLYSFLCERLIYKERNWNYFAPQPGVAWFVLWLLVLSMSYSILQAAGGECMKFARPSLGGLLLWGAVLGFIQGLLASFQMSGYSLMLPKPGDIVFTVVFFTAGCMAKSNSWLKEPITDKDFLTATISALFFLGTLYISTVQSSFQKHNHSRLAMAFKYSWQGVGCMVTVVAEVAFFQRYVNYRSALTIFFSDAAYTAYIIHVDVLLPLLWSYIFFLKVVLNVEASIPPANTISDFSSSEEGLVWLGWVYMAFSSQLVVWPLSWSICKLPGLRQVL